MNPIDLTARERAETEILTLSAEMVERAEQAAFDHVAKLARRVAETAETLTTHETNPA
ncbi:hypothetical protein [Neotabrizicola sp. sgz301269]|uniref:hypothetical protein n=1 Tax=Neotabrizicola sp. sgz301269 TaxID=3276282 RepID=UPI0037702291